MMQGDTLILYLFIIFLEPLLQWLEKTNLEYRINTSTTTCNIKAYAGSLAIIINTIWNIQLQIYKLQIRISEWAHLGLNLL